MHAIVKEEKETNYTLNLMLMLCNFLLLFQEALKDIVKISLDVSKIREILGVDGPTVIT